jgi:hypothetical protein
MRALDRRPSAWARARLFFSIREPVTIASWGGSSLITVWSGADSLPPWSLFEEKPYMIGLRLLLPSKAPDLVGSFSLGTVLL